MSLNHPIKSIGKAIKVLRVNQALSMKELSNRTGIRCNRLNRIEQGEKSASLMEMHLIAKALDTDIMRLIVKSNELKSLPFR